MKILFQLRQDFPNNSIAFSSDFYKDGSYKGLYMNVNGQSLVLHLTLSFLEEVDLRTPKGKTLYWTFVRYMIDYFHCQPEPGSLADSLRITIDEQTLYDYLKKKARGPVHDDENEGSNNKELPVYEGDEEEIYKKIMADTEGKFSDLIRDYTHRK